MAKMEKKEEQMDTIRISRNSYKVMKGNLIDMKHHSRNKNLLLWAHE